ncbi:hypothetical protein pEaSNUABM5_00083 [Erwinia phage pEa_SNUABM_5]|uniref:Uncharacterized protein n=1 Tax=Erwinia phage pEa_SNUABM_5 TaxID=2797313 RepID=A0A7T8IVJ8_9CAUD|nr:hypothetical protein MPK73_gp083 [Erwinia phage pEa_SNUABM_5]QQO90225.1 hypothetical protein pEaSNUABM5_00083 [Erwinia phage pEa_SNUABM_5]
MKILPLNIAQATARYYQAMFVDGPLPNPLAYTMQDLFNKALTTKWYYRTIAAQPAGSFVYLPQDRTTANVCGATYPAQTSYVLSDGRRRLFPDVRFSGRIPRIPANLPLLKDYGDWLHNTIMWHRADVGYYPSASLYMKPADTYVSDEGWGIVAQYDFGAAVTVTSLAALTQLNSNNYNVFPSVKSNNDNWVQALIGSVWTDVASCTDNLTTVSSTAEKVYILPAAVTAQKFRIVNKKGPGNQASPAFGWVQFSLNFYGQYASGTDFRAVPEIGHMVLVGGGTNAGAAFSTSEGMSSVNYSATSAQYGFSVTKDLAQAGTQDVFMPVLSFTPGIEVNPPTIFLSFKSVIGSAV